LVHEPVSGWHRRLSRAKLDAIIISTTLHVDARHRTPPPLGRCPCWRGGLSGCLRMRELGAWWSLRCRVDELNTVAWSTSWRPASASTDPGPGPAAAAAAAPLGGADDAGAGLDDSGRLHADSADDVLSSAHDASRPDLSVAGV